ncbi:hypothetical protein GCG21_15645 [Pseudactinotalea sp. HY160]|uniref:hypothetical protein n=1 Tax=Pseudactinotalea sp. HY160 TaxID=2654490 RepID=UPI00128E52BF|nr:hypothetical protein [Pseudactinotalea sp. HY160]MPV51418.1 hypothetical protein [Pseudactinotalea sp. HY160]
MVTIAQSLPAVLAITPYLIGYQPAGAVTTTGIRRDHQHEFLLTGTVTFHPAHHQGPGRAEDAAARAYEALRGRGAERYLVTAWGTVADLCATAAAIHAALARAAGRESTLAVQVAGQYYRYLDQSVMPEDGRWLALGVAPARLRDCFASPARDRATALARLRPAPVPAYVMPGPRMRAVLDALTPAEAAAGALDGIDEYASTGVLGTAGTPPGEVAHLLTRDSGPRDLALARLCRPSPVVADTVRVHMLTELARGCPDPAARAGLYAVAAAAAWLTSSPTIHTDALLAGADRPNALAHLVGLALETGQDAPATRRHIARLDLARLEAAADRAWYTRPPGPRKRDTPRPGVDPDNGVTP